MVFLFSFYNYHFSYKLDQEDDNEKYNALQIENTKLRMKKFNPVKRVHEWFVEAKLPPHSK